MTSTLSVTPIGVFTQNYLVAHVDSIIAFAKATGVPAVAIAGAAAEEMRNVYTDQIDENTGTVFGTKNIFDSFLDGRVWRAGQYKTANTYVIVIPI